MESNQSNSAIANDVLHNDHPSKLSAEEIAKALAHHNRRHSGEEQQKKGSAKPVADKKRT